MELPCPVDCVKGLLLQKSLSWRSQMGGNTNSQVALWNSHLGQPEVNTFYLQWSVQVGCRLGYGGKIGSTRPGVISNDTCLKDGCRYICEVGFINAVLFCWLKRVRLWHTCSICPLGTVHLSNSIGGTWRFRIVGRVGHHLKVSVSDELGIPKHQFYHLKNRSFKYYIVKLKLQQKVLKPLMSYPQLTPLQLALRSARYSSIVWLFFCRKKNIHLFSLVINI